MFKYPKEIRRIIDNTNAIENSIASFEKLQKQNVFVSDDALMKQLYLVTMKSLKNG